jgi:hypothetical protein
MRIALCERGATDLFKLMQTIDEIVNALFKNGDAFEDCLDPLLGARHRADKLADNKLSQTKIKQMEK